MLDRRRFLALSGAAVLSAAAPTALAPALELGDAERLVLDNRERGLRIIGSRAEFVAARRLLRPARPLPVSPRAPRQRARRQ